MSDTLKDKSILIVEDEYFIAADLKRALSERGVRVVGPAGTLQSGLALAEWENLDGALLDVNLQGHDSIPVARRLESRTIPYLLVTGYDDWSLPDAYRRAKKLSKPFQVGAVVGALEEILVSRRQA